TPLAVPCFQPLVSLRGSLAELRGAIAEAAALGRDECPVWLDVTVASDDYLSDLATPLGELCSGLPVELLRLRRARGTAQASLFSSARETLDELTSEDVFTRRLGEETLDPELQQRLGALHREVLAEL